MQRSIAQWRLCNPEVMANGQSRAAILHAFVAAKSDILELHAQNKEMREMLRVIAYPRRGTVEEERDVFDIAALIQQKYSLADLDESYQETAVAEVSR